MISTSQKYYAALLHQASCINLSLLFLVYVQSVGVVLPWAEAELIGLSGGTGPLHLLFSYTPEEAYTMIKAYGAQGRVLYAALTVTVYLVHPLIYSLLLVGSLLFFYSRIPGVPDCFPRNIILVPVVVLVADLTENISVLFMLIDYPYPHYNLAMVSSVLTSLQWSLWLVTLLLILVGASAYTWLHVRDVVRKRLAKVSVRSNQDLP